MSNQPNSSGQMKQFPDWVFDGATQFQSRLRNIVQPVARRAWKFELSGFDRLPEHGPAILCPNHISFLDSALVMILSPRNISFIGKSEYMDSWKTRWFFPKVGMIPVDRSGGEKSHAALDAAERVLRRGELFGIFPEGTRSRDGMLYKGHTGAARLALKVGCPIFPVGIVGTREIQPPDAPLPKLGGRVKISIGRPIEVSRYTARGNDPMVLREITDELMFEIREMTGQEYRNTYATKKRTETIVAETAEIPRFAEAHIANVEKQHA
ncbi:MAG: lysophospholipid acyltransferase family protein [Actinomycetota bacterium]